MDKLYTKKDIARATGLSEDTVRKYCQNKTIKAQKIGSVGRDGGGMFVVDEEEMNKLKEKYKKS